MTRHAFIVRDNDDGQPLGLVQPLQHSQQILGRARVEIAGWLVGEQQLRAVDKRAGYGHTLLLAARERGGFVIHPVC